MIVKDYVMPVLQSLWESRWDTFLLAGIVIFRKDLLMAFRGGNGHWQMDEIAKALVLLVFYLSFRAEATRVDLSHPVFGDAYWFALLGSVALLAGLKEGKYLLKRAADNKDYQSVHPPSPGVSNPGS